MRTARCSLIKVEFAGQQPCCHLLKMQKSPPPTPLFFSCSIETWKTATREERRWFFFFWWYCTFHWKKRRKLSEHSSFLFLGFSSREVHVLRGSSSLTSTSVLMFFFFVCVHCVFWWLLWFISSHFLYFHVRKQQTSGHEWHLLGYSCDWPRRHSHFATWVTGLLSARLPFREKMHRSQTSRTWFLSRLYCYCQQQRALKCLHFNV